MNLKITYYLDVTSSWCHWAEPTWAELKRRYSGPAEFDWKVALLGPDALPASPTQEDWFYRRSGTITGSSYVLNSGWMESGLHEYQVTQRPTFVLDSGIGDRAVFSGFWRLEPVVAAVESMLADAAAYESWRAHFGDPPEKA